MKHFAKIGLLAAVAITSLVSCDGLSLDSNWRDGKYVLLAVDSRGQMNLAFDQGNGTALGLVGPTVFSVGSDDKYIVLMQHPSKDKFGAFDRSVTNYYVVERRPGSSFQDRQKGVRGPLSEDEFEKLKLSLSLPKFTKTFDDLK